MTATILNEIEEAKKLEAFRLKHLKDKLESIQRYVGEIELREDTCPAQLIENELKSLRLKRERWLEARIRVETLDDLLKLRKREIEEAREKLARFEDAELAAANEEAIREQEELEEAGR